MTAKLLTEQHFEFLSFKENCTGSSESTLVKIPHCWKSRVVAPFFNFAASLRSHISLNIAETEECLILFDLILNVPSTIFQL